MKSFNKVFAAVLIMIMLIFITANTIILKSGSDSSRSGRPYRVEINRIALKIKEEGIESINLSEYKYVINIKGFTDEKDTMFFNSSDSDYVIREINGELYRFDYLYNPFIDKTKIVVVINSAIAVISLAVILVMIFLRRKIIYPFEQISDIPFQLSKGILTLPIKENKSKFFGKFLWGINMLRENIEQQKKRELDLQKEKKTLLLSLSHDIKTPLSAIKLYSKALSRGLYSDIEKQIEIAENINIKADEIEHYISQIITASREDFLSLYVNLDSFYLSNLVKNITDYYSEKLSLIKTNFKVEKYSDCLIKGDFNRSLEVLQNIIENAIKYGDGKYIEISFSFEEDCILICVKNSGCTLSDIELLHIFESFWRGQNSKGIQGSGLGLYICRSLMHKMDGEIFAEIDNEFMKVTLVFELM